MPSRRFLENMIATSDDDIPLTFLTLSHPNLPDWDDLSGDDIPPPLGWVSGFMHFVANDENITRELSSGDTEFLAWGFDFTPPHQDGTSRSAGFRMDNVDSRIFQAIKLLPADTRIECRVEIAMSSNPNLTENFYSGFFLTAVNADFTDLQFTVTGNHGGNQPVNSVNYRPFNAPGLYI